MEDNQIINLYFDRSEQAIKETDTKYGGYCYSIAYNILTNQEDAEETTAPLQTDTSDNEIPWNGPRRVYQLAQNAARGQLYKLGPVNDFLRMQIGEHYENKNFYPFRIAFISSNCLWKSRPHSRKHQCTLGNRNAGFSWRFQRCNSVPGKG